MKLFCQKQFLRAYDLSSLNLFIAFKTTSKSQAAINLINFHHMGKVLYSLCQNICYIFGENSAIVFYPNKLFKVIYHNSSANHGSNYLDAEIPAGWGAVAAEQALALIHHGMTAFQAEGFLRTGFQAGATSGTPLIDV